MGKTIVRENFQQADWDEPLIYEMSTPGERGIRVPEPDNEVKKEAGDVLAELPDEISREEKPELPEVAKKHVLMHWLHLAQETMGSNLTNDISEGTCTMKYNPRINEQLVQHDDFTNLHPLQDDETVQGILEIYKRFENILQEVSGLDRVTFQPGGGNHAVYTAASIMRKHFEKKGELDQRDEIITTIYSHPSDAACPQHAGFKVITIYPDEDGLPDLEAFKEALSENTAGVFMTNPEDIGLYNPRIDKFVEAVHDVGGLCFYDQANANAFLGIARAREAGFDMCHFNLHKTFGTPHGGSGPGNGALCVRDELAKYLPRPTVEYDGKNYYLDYDRPQSIGKVRDFYGTAAVVLRAYAWTRAMGVEGLRETAEISVLNNNYLYEKLDEEIPTLSYSYYDNDFRRMEQVRYTWEQLKDETGVGTADIERRVADYGIQHYWASHHPWLIPEPMTLEPCETYSKGDMDEYIEVLKRIEQEAKEDPELVQNSPYKAASSKRLDNEALTDPEKWALTYRAFKKKKDKYDGEI
ncbi:aminomethyl-transferring glycine dehydrogenase subunit GcvPB [Halarsenatibacter silvermanii]|uniref:Glycine dehydrogenase subunit 2 n=1 Tax=Halarsenatibacter silvermanii TaxID=321763 RepID=A0A1G9ITW4_9FIRM|nr:aminomethyl-transferring glycine dehydrogenase subunit GcvPB [Halarsenatibacter silvermanii]SDL28234.1 glycine dehydrogenase subunit 2 [Halarsenatibacter silvermanii]